MRSLVSLVVVAVLTGCGPPPPYPSERASEPAHSAASLDGSVLGVDHVTPADRLASGVRLRVEVGGASPVVVDLAPDWYLDRHGLHFAPSERVRVEGSRHGSEPVIYATRIRKGGKTVELRDPTSGRPLWEN